MCFSPPLHKSVNLCSHKIKICTSKTLNFLRDAIKSSHLFLCMQIYLLYFNPQPLGFTIRVSFKYVRHTCTNFHFQNKAHLSSFFRLPAPHLHFIKLLVYWNPDVDPLEFQEWHNKTQEMEKPNGKTKQAENPTFFKHFSPGFLTTNLLRVFFHFFSTQVSCTYKRTSWHCNTKQPLGHKEHKGSSLRAALPDLGPFPLPHSQSVVMNTYLF